MNNLRIDFMGIILSNYKDKREKIVTHVKLYDIHGRIVLPPRDDSSTSERAGYNARSARKIVGSAMRRRP